ncbi:MAG: hypothetical protein DRO93_09755 [Candidatus Thorarchaeota archaeon]|nr:MAG: hypothetical protein DRO93_09755 [Candidatus Thorarchaeota archaeon]
MGVGSIRSFRFSRSGTVVGVVMFVLIMTSPLTTEHTYSTAVSNYGGHVSSDGGPTVFANATCRGLRGPPPYNYGPWADLSPDECPGTAADGLGATYGVQVLVDVCNPDGIDSVWFVSERQSDGLTVNGSMCWMFEVEKNESFPYPPPVNNNTYLGGFSALRENDYEYWDIRFYANDTTGEVYVSEEYHFYVRVYGPDLTPTTTASDTLLSPAAMSWVAVGAVGVGVVALVIVFLRRRGLVL